MNAEQQRQIRVEAARWLAALHSGEVDPRREAEFIEWQSQTPEHARCIAQLNEKLGFIQASALRDLSTNQLQRALSVPSSRRQFLRGTLAVSTIAIAAGLFTRLGSTGFSWPGDLYTGIGERNNFELADGSNLTLNAASRVTPHFAERQRALQLHTGELVLDVKDEPQPFLIEVSGARIQASRRRLLLRHEAGGCYVVALEDDLQLQTAKGWETLGKGRWARMGPSKVWQTGVAPGGDTLWLRGLMEADARPLREVINALRPYRQGVMELSSAVADLRISGLLPLDDSDHALAMLTSIAPIKVTRLTDLWIRIDKA